MFESSMTIGMSTDASASAVGSEPIFAPARMRRSISCFCAPRSAKIRRMSRLSTSSGTGSAMSSRITASRSRRISSAVW